MGEALEGGGWGHGGLWGWGIELELELELQLEPSSLILLRKSFGVFESSEDGEREKEKQNVFTRGYLHSALFKPSSSSNSIKGELLFYNFMNFFFACFGLYSDEINTCSQVFQ